MTTFSKYKMVYNSKWIIVCSKGATTPLMRPVIQDKKTEFSFCSKQMVVVLGVYTVQKIVFTYLTCPDETVSVSVSALDSSVRL